MYRLACGPLNNKTPAVATGRLLCAPPCVCTALCVHRFVCEPPNPPYPPPVPPPVPPPRTSPRTSEVRGGDFLPYMVHQLESEPEMESELESVHRPELQMVLRAAMWMVGQGRRNQKAGKNCGKWESRKLHADPPLPQFAPTLHPSSC